MSDKLKVNIIVWRKEIFVKCYNK